MIYLIKFDISEKEKPQSILNEFHQELLKLEGYNGAKFGDVAIHPNSNECAVKFNPFKVLQWAETILNIVNSMGYAGNISAYTNDWDAKDENIS